MSSQAETASPADLLGQTVVVIGGSSGMGLETARLARAHGAEVVLVARNADRLRAAAEQVGARHTEAFDLTDLARVEQFFADLPEPVDHIMVTGPGPYYSPLKDMDFAAASRDINERLLVTLAVARFGAAKMRPPGTLLFIGGTGGRRRRRSHAHLGLDGGPPTAGREPGPRAGTDPRRMSSPPASSTRPCRRRSSATSWKPAGPSCAPRCPSAASSDRPTSRRWPSIS